MCLNAITKSNQPGFFKLSIICSYGKLVFKGNRYIWKQLKIKRNIFTFALEIVYYFNWGLLRWPNKEEQKC